MPFIYRHECILWALSKCEIVFNRDLLCGSCGMKCGATLMATMLTGLPDGAIHKMDGLMDLKCHIFFVLIIHFNWTRIKEKNYAPHFPTFWSAKPAVCFSSTWFFLSIRYFVFSFIFVHLHTLEWNNLSYIRLCTLCTYSVQKTHDYMNVLQFRVKGWHARCLYAASVVLLVLKR